MKHFDPSGQAWLCTPEQIPGIVERINLAIDSYAESPGDDEGDEAPYEIDDEGVATIKIHGPIVAGLPEFLYDWMGLVDPVAVEDALLMASTDGAVKKVSLDIDSPGGYSGYIPELADTVYAMEKPVHARVTGLAASAAYWIAVQARTVKAGQASEVGSIGAYAVMVDSSQAAADAGITVHVISSDELKGAGVPGSPVTEEQIAVQAELVDQLTDQFKAAVMRGRGDKVEEETLAGRVWLAPEAVKLGLIDGIVSNRMERQMNLEKMTEQYTEVQAERDQAVNALATLQATHTESEQKYTALLAEHNATGENLENLMAEHDKLAAQVIETEARQAKDTGDALIESYQAKGLQEFKLFATGDDDKKTPKRLHNLAYTDPAAFEEMATDALPRTALQEENAGAAGEANLDTDDEGTALKMAKDHCNEHLTAEFSDTFIKAQAVVAGKRKSIGGE